MGPFTSSFNLVINKCHKIFLQSYEVRSIDLYDFCKFCQKFVKYLHTQILDSRGLNELTSVRLAYEKLLLASLVKSLIRYFKALKNVHF